MKNRKQRTFADIARVMAPNQQIVRGSRALRSMHLSLDGGGGGAAVVELKPHVYDGKTYNLNEKISFSVEAPEKDLHGYIEAIKYNMLEAQKTRGLTRAEADEILKQGAADLATTFDSYKECLADYQKTLRERAAPGPYEGKKLDLRRVDLHFDPRQQKDRDDLAGMSRAHYNFVCLTPDQLGADDPETRKAIDRFQFLHDDLITRSLYAQKTDPNFSARGGWESLRRAEEYKALALALGQGIRETLVGPAINETNAEEGKNWVPPTILSSRIFPLIEEELSLLGAFETIPMPGPDYRLGVMGSHMVSFKLNENILDDGGTSGGTIVPSYFKTKKMDLSAKHHAAGAVVTPAWLQDSIAGADDVLRDLAYAIARGREKWMLSGQLTSALDAVTIANDDIRKMGDGLRYWYSQMKAAGLVVDIDFSAGVTAEGLVQMFGQQRSYGNRPRRSIWIVNVATAAQLLVLKSTAGGQIVLGTNEGSDRATFRSGSLGQMFGRDIIVVNDLADTMNAVGIEPAVASDRSIILHVFTDAVKVGSRLGIQLAYSTDARFFQYQECFRAVARDDIGRVYDPVTEPFISQGVGIRKV